METDVQLLRATQAYATEILENHLDQGYSYHTLDHTQQVVEATTTIGQEMGLKPEEVNLLKTAAWLHDLGYIRVYLRHEEASMAMAREFLERQGANPALIDRVVRLIEATKLNQEPRDTLEAILKDADLSNLATDQALENAELIREEWSRFCNREYSDLEWDEFNYNFYKSHQYYTAYGKQVLDPPKQEHIRTLKKRIKKVKKKEQVADRAALEHQLEKAESKLAKAKRKLKRAKEQKPDRGIETMFRTTYRTHINLSSIADNKANILLSINAIIISIVFSSVIDKYDLIERNESLSAIVIPSFGMLLVCMTTIVFAILSTRPKVNSGTFAREDIINKKTNLLFFGNFHSMNLDDFQWGIGEMMQDADYLYGSMAKDIYFLGRVLAKKFQLLRIAYNVFMYGMGISVLAIALVFWMAKSGFFK